MNNHIKNGKSDCHTYDKYHLNILYNLWKIVKAK